MSSERKYSLLEAKAKLEYLCAYQERCAFELERKMKSWGIDLEDQGILLANLIENNYLSEERFSEAFVSGKVNIKRWGRIKIRQELKARQIAEYSIKKGLSQIDESVYWNNILHLAEQKVARLSKEGNDFKKRMKLLQFLVSKGYETDIANDAANEVLPNN